MHNYTQGSLEGRACTLAGWWVGPDLRWASRAGWVISGVSQPPCFLRADQNQGLVLLRRRTAGVTRADAAGAALPSWPGAHCLHPSSCRNSLGEQSVFLFYFYFLKSGTKRGQRQSAEGSEPGEWGSQANRKCLRRSSHMSLAGADTQHPKCGWGPVDLTKLSPRRD